MKLNIIIGIFTLFISSNLKGQNLDILEDKKIKVNVGISGLESIETKLGFDDTILKSEINQILRSNGFSITNSALSNFQVYFTCDAILLDNRSIVYSVNASIVVSESLAMIKKSLEEEATDNDVYLLKYFKIYDKGYNGIVGEFNYSEIKTAIINLSRILVEDYHTEISN